MNTTYAVLGLAQATGHRSMVHAVISSLPTDAASLFTLALAVGVSVLVIVAGRKSGAKHENVKKRTLSS